MDSRRAIAAWLAFMIGLIAGRDVHDLTSFAIGAASGLFLMSVIAWLVSRFTKNPSIVFAAALVASSLVFALLHLARPFPGDPSMASFYRAALVAKYTLGALPLGWLFWRWGLPYAILCHAAVNATHLVVQSFVF